MADNITGGKGYDLQPLAKSAGDVVTAFTDLLKVERQAIDAADKKQKAEREASDAETRGAANKSAAMKAFVDLIQGNFVGAIKGAISILSGGTGNSAVKAASMAGGSSPSQAQMVTGAAKAGGEGAGMAEAGAAAGPAGAVVGAVVSALSALKDKLTGFAAAASPAAFKSLSQVTQLLAAQLGQYLAPVVFRVGQALTLASDLLAEFGPSLADGAGAVNDVLAEVGGFFMSLQNPIDAVTFALGTLAQGMIWMAEQFVKLMSGLLRKIPGMGGLTKGNDKILEWLQGLRAGIGETKRAVHQGGPLEHLLSLTGAKKGLQDRWKTAGEKFVKNTEQNQHGPAQYESIESTYKRIQQAAVGKNTFEQDLLDIQRRALEEQIKTATNTGRPGVPAVGA